MSVILITGGSRGIGAATALLAAEQGYDVGFSYHSNKSAADDVLAKLENFGRKAVAVQADVADEKQVVNLFETVDGLGRLSVLVNNAGVLEQQMRVEQMDAARLRRVFDVNVVGAFMCCREAILRMSTRRGGRGGAIVNVSSGAARLGSAGEYVDYAASKGALDTLTLGLSQELASEGIRVNTVRPGFIDTDIHASGGEPERLERVKNAIPLQRAGSPTEVAEAILWLASDKASYSTGAFLDVTGGR